MKTPKFIMVVGLPGSGKSTFLKENYKDCSIHSSDDIRLELFDDINCQDNNQLVFETLHNRIRRNLENGISCCFDATNLSSKRRRVFLDELKSIRCFKKCIVIATPFEECVKNDASRDRSVGENVISKMRERFQFPQKNEDWDEVEVKYTNEEYKSFYDINNVISRLSDIEQNNKHHTLTIGKHCSATYCYIRDHYVMDFYLKNVSEDSINTIMSSALLHDIGKEYTATYINRKTNEIDKNCHYYGHENVGAYNSMFFYDVSNNSNVLHNVILLINNHMKMYSNKNNSNVSREKTLQKIKNAVGKENFKLLEILHEADVGCSTFSELVY